MEVVASEEGTLPKGHRRLRWPLSQSDSVRLVVSFAIIGLTVWLMRNWLGAALLGRGVPSSHRREMFTELTLTWMFREEMASGHLLSEWNPVWFSGFPWLRFLSYPLYYALAAISFWRGARLESLMVYCYFLVLAGSGLVMYTYLREVVGDWRAALLGAVIYELFPFHSHVGVETWIHAAFWVLLPLPLLCAELARRDDDRRTHYLLLAGVTLGLLPIISSEYAILCGPFVVLYLILREWGQVRRGLKSLPQASAHLALIGLVALGISCFILLPALMEVRYVGIHAKHGAETTFTNQLLRDYSVTPRLMWYAIAKRFRLPASTEGLPALRYSFWSIAWYPGLTVLPLAGLGLSAVKRRFAARAALAALILSLLQITGPTFLLNPFTYLPVYGRLSPFRGMLLAGSSLAVLAAFGGHWLLAACARPFGDRHERADQVPPDGLATPQRWVADRLRRPLRALHALVVRPTVRRLSPWAVWAGMLLLVVFDLKGSADAYQTMETCFSADELRAYAWLARHADQGRLLEPAEAPRDQYLRAYSLSEAPIPRFSGYYDNGAPLYTWQQNAWTDLRTLLHLHRVRYALLRSEESLAQRFQQQLDTYGYRVVFTAGDVQIWENPQVQGYSQFYERAVLDLTNDLYRSFEALPQLVWRGIAMVNDDALATASSANLERYSHILRQEPDLRAFANSLGWPEERLVTVSDLGGLEPSLGTEAIAWSERADYETIRLEVQAPERGLLTIAESWYPHWRVTVDGVPDQVVRANWALMGVWLEPGSHQVIFYFQRPWYVYMGYTISLAVVLGLVWWWLRCLTRALDRAPEIPIPEGLPAWGAPTRSREVGEGESGFDPT